MILGRRVSNRHHHMLSDDLRWRRNWYSDFDDFLNNLGRGRRSHHSFVDYDRVLFDIDRHFLLANDNLRFRLEVTPDEVV